MIRIPSGGMETPVSLMLLLVAAMAISAILVNQVHEDGDPDLAGLRTYQARSLASALADYRTAGGSDLSDLITSVPVHIYRHTDGEVEYQGDPGQAMAILDEFLSQTPDDLEASIFISDDPGTLPPLAGSRFSRSTPLGSGLTLTVTLPLHRGSMRQEVPI
jgi:hypothetical protein